STISIASSHRRLSRWPSRRRRFASSSSRSTTAPAPSTCSPGPDRKGTGRSAFQWTMLYMDRPIMDTIAILVYHNLLGRFPDVQVASIENGSTWVPYLLKSMDMMKGMARNGPRPGGYPRGRPSEIFRQHVYVEPHHLRRRGRSGGPHRRRPGDVRLRLPPPRGAVGRGRLSEQGGRLRHPAQALRRRRPQGDARQRVASGRPRWLSDPL